MEDQTTVDRVRMERATGPQIDVLLDHLLYKPPGYLQVGPEQVFLPSFYSNWHTKYTNFPVYQDDIWVVTYPKSGTTWMQELVWCLMNDPKSPESSLELMKRSPFFEHDVILPSDERCLDATTDDYMPPVNTLSILQDLAAPRIIKSHLPKELLPKQIWEVKPKVVYVCRDPRDVCVSFYYQYVKRKGYSGTFHEFSDLFLHQNVLYAPFWRHILNFWKMRHQHHILFIRFEDMKEDLAAIVRKVAGFLGKEVDDDEVAWLTHHCSFPQMRNNPAVNKDAYFSAPTEEAKGIKFMRKGESGDWKNYLTEDQKKVFKTWTLQNLHGSHFLYYQDYD